MKTLLHVLWRGLALVLVTALALQVYFALRVAMMTVVDPASTTFQRSEASRLLRTQGQVLWSQTWRDDARIGVALKRAVIASEDAGFVDHSGVEWDAIEKAWERNLRAKADAERALKTKRGASAAAPATNARPAKLVGGSTISQQLAKNLYLHGERNVLRKGQEFVITLWLEAFLDKRRILEIYLNHVEWGEGVFGAQAAARHYHRVDAERLSAWQAAQLAVMLPAPKRFEKRPGSPYVLGRAETIVARMPGVQLP